MKIEIAFKDLPKHILSLIQDKKNLLSRIGAPMSQAMLVIIFAMENIYQDLLNRTNTTQKYLFSIVLNHVNNLFVIRTDDYTEPLITCLKAKQSIDKSRYKGSNEATGEFIELTNYPTELVIMITDILAPVSDSPLAFNPPGSKEFILINELDFVFGTSSCTIKMINPFASMPKEQGIKK